MMEFFAMGGHGLYIWGSYGAAALLMIGEALWVWRRHRKAGVELSRAENEMGASQATGGQQ